MAGRGLGGALAAAFLAGTWDEDGLLDRGRQALSPRPRWLKALVRETLGFYHRPPLDRPRELAALIDVLIDRRPTAPAGRTPRVVRHFAFTTQMGRVRWPVPVLDTVGDLAAHLKLEPAALEWFADARSLERRASAERLRHYRYAWRPRPGGPVRVIEAPKARLKALQRRLLREILMPIPVHDAAHGFVAGRGVRDHAAAHAGRRVLVRFDLEDFFAGVGAGRVYGILRTAGYPENVAHTLTALMTNVVPEDEWAGVPRPETPWAITAHHQLGRRLAAPHLPQGAPTSPALANLTAFNLDRRLAGLAARYDVTYTRYADDLAFSGGDGLLRAAAGFRRAVGLIVRDEGWRLNDRKHQLMTDAGRQRLAGMVVNAHPNVAREEYDRLKALLHNAARTGPATQDRGDHADFRAHVRGRIAWVQAVNPARGARLLERYERIDWEPRQT